MENESTPFVFACGIPATVALTEKPPACTGGFGLLIAENVVITGLAVFLSFAL